MQHTVEEVRLKNGAEGLLIDVPDATVMSMQFHFRAGNRFAKTPEIEQVAHIMEHMAFGANARFKREHDFEAEFTKNGADHNAYTSDFSMVYEADCADFEWERILDLQRLSICEPRFNEQELEAEKGNVRAELTNYLNDHHRILWPRIQQLLGEDVLTFRQGLATIPHVSLRDIREHHKRTHTTDNMRFVIAGKMHGRRATILRELEAFDLPRGEHFAVPHDELRSAGPAIVRRKDASNLTFGWSLTVPTMLHSRIFGRARSKGLAYHVGAYAGIRPYDSSWDITGQVNHDTAAKLFTLMRDELRNVLDGGITEAELEAAKSYALGRHQMGAQTVAQISGFYTSRYFADGSIKGYDDVPNRIRRVTQKRMTDVAREFVAANTWVFAAVSSGDKAELVEYNDIISELFA
jgi:zinc protease